MGLLKFLFIAITVLWLIRMVARLLFPWAMRRMAEKVMGNAQRQYQYRNNPYNTNANGGNFQQPRQPEGEVRIDYMPPQNKPKRGAKSAGEFVEFEEIKSSAK
ncbi:DUF4834 family protein [Parapedobacter koreensis]|uniref:DUF4834 domain-containing protein n=1 Tax=Parapedobacter koreensis TaxID=332977 RepID=A0A1H7J9Z8_9SPHI|nr:DUF4834 family protein [Parapedobacter koreensis]SEK71521.1 protein of unknown function [Parapedobacter koreensis]